MKLIEHFVNGKIIPGSSDRKGKVFNPATGEQESEVRLASKSDLDQAVEAAKKAFETWSAKPPLQRARIIFKFKELIEKNSDELTKLIVSEHGKVFEDARGSLTRGLEVVEFACGIPHLLKGEYSENVGTNVDSWSMRQPLGVVAGITPFNFPAMVPMWMFPIAIACGNTFILKPSEKDPSGPKKDFGRNVNLKFENTAAKACDKADLIIINTEWDEFKSIDFKRIVNNNNFKIFDLRNLYSPNELKKRKIRYYSIGR